MDYLNCFQDLITLCGLTEGPVKSYSIYFFVYLNYMADHLHVHPPQATYSLMREFISWIQQQRDLSLHLRR